MPETRRRIATYERVSSEDQRERETIRTQTEEIARRLAATPDVESIERYVDDGISGTVPMVDRPEGARLMADATAGRYDELWVYRIDRLGRDDVDPLVVWRDLEQCGVRVYSVTEGVNSPFEYHIRVAMAAEERRAFLARSAAGIARAVTDGRFPGGIVPYGYRLEGRKGQARLEIDTSLAFGDLTAVGVIRMIFRLAAIEQKSTRGIARYLNDLGIPTAYARAARAVRKRRTQGIWTPGRVQQILKNSTYRGEYHYGKRTKKANRPVLIAQVSAAVDEDVWYAAQRVMATRARVPESACRKYLLRSVIVCAICGLHFTGTKSHGDTWYRCNGQLIARGPLRGRCTAKGVKGDYLEPAIWADIERFLRNPGDLVSELEQEMAGADQSAAAVAEAERRTLEAALVGLADKRARLLDLYLDAKFSRAELDRRCAAIDEQRAKLETSLASLQQASAPTPEPPASPNVLAEIGERLEAGLTNEQRGEIVRLLVRRVTIHTTVGPDQRKTAKAVVEYAFPSVVTACTGIRAGRNYTLRRVVSV